MTHALTIRTSTDLEAAWRFVDGGHGYSAPQTFALVVEANGDVVPTIIQVYDDELGDDDRDEMVAHLVDALKEAFVVGNPGSTIAVMRARPGRRTMTLDDGAWCRTIHEQLARAGLDSFPMFFATDESLGPVPPDVLVAAA